MSTVSTEYQTTAVTPVEPGLVARWWDADGERIVRTEPVVAWMVREHYEVLKSDPSCRRYLGTEVTAAVLHPESGTLMAVSEAHPQFGDVRREADLARTPTTRISEADIIAIRDGSPIEEIVSGYGVVLEPITTGASVLKGVCPLHRGVNLSFRVRPGHGTFHCLGCEEAGDVIAFVMKAEQVGFHEAARRLADRAGIELHHEAVSR